MCKYHIICEFDHTLHQPPHVQMSSVVINTFVAEMETTVDLTSLESTSKNNAARILAKN